MSMIRAIIEIPQEALRGDGDASDEITDRLIEEFDTPMIGVLDVVEEGEPAWYRSERF